MVFMHDFSVNEKGEKDIEITENDLEENVME